MAAVRVIGSLYIYSEAGVAVGRGGGQKAVGGTQGQQLEEIGESPAREGGAGQGLGVSLNPSADSGKPQTPAFQDVIF